MVASKFQVLLIRKSARGGASFSSRDLTYYFNEGLAKLMFRKRIYQRNNPEATERREGAFSRVERALSHSDMSGLPPIYRSQDSEGCYLDELAFGNAIMNDELRHHHRVFDYH